MFKQTYANQDFDAAQAIAQRLTDKDRAAGRPAPAYGYSGANFERAKVEIRRRSVEVDRGDAAPRSALPQYPM